MENSIENIHTDFMVERVKRKEKEKKIHNRKRLAVLPD